MSRSSTRCIARDRKVPRSARHSLQGRLGARGAGAVPTSPEGAAPPLTASTSDPVVTCLRFDTVAHDPLPRATARLVAFEGQAVFRHSCGDLIRFRSASCTLAEEQP